MDDLIRFLCPHCRKRRKARPDQMGRVARCSCGGRMVIPGERVDAPGPVTEQVQARPVHPTKLLVEAGVLVLLFVLTAAGSMVALFGLADQQTRLVMVISAAFVIALTTVVTVAGLALTAAGAFPRDRVSRLNSYIDPQRLLKP